MNRNISKRESHRLTLTGVLLDGPPVRLRDLEYITGLDAQTLRRDVKGGYLKVIVRQSGPKYSIFLVERVEARRYLIAAGYLRQSPQSPQSLSIKTQSLHTARA